MKKHLFTCLFALFTLSMASGQVQYEDFDGGTADFSWIVLNGTAGQTVDVVANPDATGVNTSASVGKIVNNAASDFTFALGTAPNPPINLAIYSQIKMKVWSPVAGHKVLFKFEGGGKGVEEFKTIPVGGQWVEMSFNLNCGSEFTGLEKCLIAFNPFTTNAGETYYFDDVRGVLPGQEMESFEAASSTTAWSGLGSNLTLDFPNPTPNAVNSSAKCAKFERNPNEAWTAALGVFAVPFDLSSNNQFKIKVLVDHKAEILFKLEGGSNPVEVRKNIGVANAWQEYTFDFSAKKDVVDYTKMVIFFAPNGAGDPGVFYFDDIQIVPKSCDCKNAVAEPIIDDFECNRNATYDNGWDVLETVANPQPNGDNPSKKVGKYTDPLTSPWEALVVDYFTPIDLATKNVLRAKIWSPKDCNILFKLEGGSSPAKEVWKPATANSWINFEVDFASQAAASHKRIAIFFNGGQDAVAGDVYYIDDLKWEEAGATVLEDFETGTAFLPWEPLDQNTVLNGIFSIENNPAPVGNTSTKVGKYTKGASPFSTLAAVAPGAINITAKPQYNLDVWAPAGSLSVTMQLESATQGNKEVTRDITETGKWTTVNFDFSDHVAINDWASLRLLFDAGTAAPGAMYFFDNLTQSAATVDPCEDVVPLPNIIDDYECQRNYAYFVGAADLSVVANPQLNNTNQSTKAGKYIDPADQPYAALGVDFPAGLDLTTYNQFDILIKAPAANLPIVFKIEGGTSGGFETTPVLSSGTDWVKYRADFSSKAGGDYKRLVVFFNFGEQGPSAEWYVDNLRLSRADYTGCISTFDAPSLSLPTWKFFENGTLTPAQGFEVIDNPSKTGINTSLKVGKATEAGLDNGGAQVWGGMFADLEAPIKFSGAKLMRMKVLMPAAPRKVTMKLEVPLNPAAGGTGDNNQEAQKAGEWEQLEWDFAAAPDDADYTRVTLIWNIDEIPATNQTYFFDDIQIGGSESCVTVSTFQPLPIAPLSVAPNPTTGELFVENGFDITRFEVLNLLGQRVATVWTNGATRTTIDASGLPTGVFMVVGLTKTGEIAGKAKFVKQ